MSPITQDNIEIAKTIYQDLLNKPRARVGILVYLNKETSYNISSSFLQEILVAMESQGSIRRTRSGVTGLEVYEAIKPPELD